MKLKRALLAALVMIANTAFTQQFCTHTGIDIANEYPRDLIQTFDGGYALSGKSDSNFTSRAFLQKYTAQGVLSWTKVIRNNFSCDAYSLIQTADSGLLMSGYVNNGSAGGNYEILLVKFSAAGNLLFSKRIGNTGASSDESSYASALCPDGNLVIACQTNKNTNSAIDILVIKISTNGNIIWAKDYIDAYFAEVPTAIKCDPAGNIMVSGYLIPAITSNPMFYNMFLIKLNPSGKVIWAQTFGGSQFDQANSLAVLNNYEGYAICGRTLSYGSPIGQEPAYICVLDTSGAIKWSRTFGLTTFNLFEFNDLAITANNEVIACGLIQNLNGIDLSMVVKYSATGTKLWEVTYNDFLPYLSRFTNIVHLGNGPAEFVVCGKTNQFNFSDNVSFSSMDMYGYNCCFLDTITGFVEDSGFVSTPWNLTDSSTTSIADNGSIGQIHNAGSTYNYCISTGIEAHSKNAVFSVSPNPANDLITVKFSTAISSTATLTIHTTLGKLVLSKTLSAGQLEQHIELNELAKGMYLIQVEEGNGIKHFQKLLKL
ncbi:MAG TPA: T9SS type A sorting domain-containing protein [Bacteroidia bacterium]|nr:T9SS type A sorting domain-containing protein [Bacteroidia bacterium]HRH09534.1 T9SS type A sorting domain-containing protein [Bacteroidia bacterium]